MNQTYVFGKGLQRKNIEVVGCFAVVSGMSSTFCSRIGRNLLHTKEPTKPSATDFLVHFIADLCNQSCSKYLF